MKGLYHFVSVYFSLVWKRKNGKRKERRENGDNDIPIEVKSIQENEGTLQKVT